MRAHLTAMVVAAFATGMFAQSPSPSEPRASMHQMLLPSHGSMLTGVLYQAGGAGPHPTAILMHGFPGYEQNLDLAQALRSDGWNVLAVHYRGSWGVKGDFSFHHAAEDADAELWFALAPENVKKYQIDPHRVIVIGHSMGGYLAASAAAHNKEIAGAVLISAWNIGADYESRRHLGASDPTVENEAKSLGEESNMAPLAGTSGMALAQEIHDHAAELNFISLAPAIAPRPILIITANEGLAPADHALVLSLQKSGDKYVSEVHFDTDHSYSDKRSDLIKAVITWLHSSMK